MDTTTIILAASALLPSESEIKSPLTDFIAIYEKMTNIANTLHNQPLYEQFTSYEEWNKLSAKALALGNTIEKSKKLTSQEKKQFRDLKKQLQKQTAKIKGIT